MLEPRIVILSKHAAYMQKQKPQPVGQPDIDTLAMRLGIKPSDCDGLVRDDVMETDDGQRHAARRLDIVERGKALLPGTEYATRPDDSPEGRVSKAVEKAAKSPALAKAKAAAAADAAEHKQLMSEQSAGAEKWEAERLAKNEYERARRARKRAEKSRSE
jgi:hypothetical protein